MRSADVDLIQDAKRRGDVDFLIAALRDPEHRTGVAESLADMGAVAAIPPLIRLLDAADPHVRSTAARALGRLGASEALIRLREIALEDEEAFVRAWAIDALGHLGDARAVDFLLPLLRDDSARVRGATALALGQLGDLRALEPLQVARRHLRRSPWEWYAHGRVYRQAVESLRRAASAREDGPD